MLAVSSAGWTGMAFIEDMNSGVMDRMLVSPAWRGAFNLGSVAQSMISVRPPDAADRAAGAGARRPLRQRDRRRARAAAGRRAAGGDLRLALATASAILTGQRETLIGAVSALLLPLTFLSGALMQLSLAPGWIGTVAKFNPVDWAATAARNATTESFDWGVVAGASGCSRR